MSSWLAGWRCCMCVSVCVYKLGVRVCVCDTHTYSLTHTQTQGLYWLVEVWLWLFTFYGGLDWVNFFFCGVGLSVLHCIVRLERERERERERHLDMHVLGHYIFSTIYSVIYCQQCYGDGKDQSVCDLVPGHSLINPNPTSTTWSNH